MKKIITTLAFIFLFSGPLFAQVKQLTADSSTIEIKFDDETWDFGDIPQKKADGTSHDFKFTNTGKYPILIADCKGDAIGKWPKNPILPGQTGIISVSHNGNHVGVFNKVCFILITSNSKTISKPLYIKGIVIATPVEQTANDSVGEFKFEEETWDFGDIPRDKADATYHDFKFINTGKYPIRINQCYGDAIGKWPLEPIQPGQTGIISVRRSGNNLGPFSKTCTVIIISNTKTIYKWLYIKGNVIATPVEQTTPEKQSSLIQVPPK